MRYVLVLLLAATLVGLRAWPVIAEGGEAEKTPNLATLLSGYLQNRLALAELLMKNLQEGQKAGIMDISDVFAAEDEVDKCQLDIRLADEGKLIADHPVLGELRRELGVPDASKALSAQKREAISTAVQEYLQKVLVRAERLLEGATLRLEMGRATQSEALAARRRVEGIKLLLAVERVNSREVSR